MDSFEITAKKEIYKIIHHSGSEGTFVIFNHETCHILKRHASGKWETAGHRFGVENIPVKEIGAAIDKYLTMQQ